MAHHITLEYDCLFIAYDENYENLVEGEGLTGTRIDTARTYLELFQTEGEFNLRLSEINL